MKHLMLLIIVVATACGAPSVTLRKQPVPPTPLTQAKQQITPQPQATAKPTKKIDHPVGADECPPNEEDY